MIIQFFVFIFLFQKNKNISGELFVNKSCSFFVGGKTAKEGAEIRRVFVCIDKSRGLM